MENQVNPAKEVQAINGPYPATFEGIRDAIAACHYDQVLGATKNNSRLVVLREDGIGIQEPVFVGRDFLDEAYEAAEIAHRFGIEHNKSLCQSCTMEDQALEDFERCADAILS